MSVVSTTLHARVEDADWTVDGVRSLIWPAGDFDLEARDPEGMTMLLLASRHGRGRMVEALLSVGVDTKAADERGYTAVCWVRTISPPPTPLPGGECSMVGRGSTLRGEIGVLFVFRATAKGKLAHDGTRQYAARMRVG